MSKKTISPEFRKYMEMIVNCNNYKGLPYKRKKDGTIVWMAAANSELGQKRQEWIDKKAKELGISGPGKNAKVAFKIHPTKEKVCQICGKKMSIRYIYPNKNFIKFLAKNYNYIFNKYDSIYDIVKFLKESNICEDDIIKLLIEKAKLQPEEIKEKNLDEIINIIEIKCRNENLKIFGPGAMSDWPDRFDGYHSYNRCCRTKEDKGRSFLNLKSYSKDRRAYEYWSDGNIIAANKFMSSKYFHGASADHIGPISLGFVHDPHFLQLMSRSANSSKRDRLSMRDFNLIKEKEKEYHITPISWFASDIWKEMKSKVNNYKDLEKYRLKLKKNMNNYMECLWIIYKNTNNNKGKNFLTRALINPKKKYFKYNYKFYSSNGDYTKVPKKQSKQLNKEYKRFIRVSFQSLEDYHNKKNRSIKSNLSSKEKKYLTNLCKKINNSASDKKILKMFKSLNKKIQRRLL